MPTLSVLIPTRNRPRSALRAIREAVSQKNENIEILVSDNSSGPFKGQLKQLLVANHILSQIQFYEQNQPLEMPANWSYLSSAAQGEYIAVLPDRWVPRIDAFQFLLRVINDNNPECIFWDSMLGLSSDGLIHGIRPMPRSICISKVKSGQLLANIMAFTGHINNTVFTQPFPRGLNSVIRRNIAEKICSKVGSFFRPLACDYTSGISTLLETNEILHIHDSLYLSYGKESNGASTSIEGWKKTGLVLCDQIERSNIYPNIDCVLSIVLHDILETIKLHGDRSANEQINLLGYYKSLIRELEFKQLRGSSLNIDKMLRSILECASSQLESTEIVDLKCFAKLVRPKFVRFRRLLRLLGIFELAMNAKEYISPKSDCALYYNDDNGLSLPIIYC